MEFVDNTVRKKWDKAEYEQKARERVADKSEGDVGAASTSTCLEDSKFRSS
jgi:hypothetical protein